MARNYYTKNGTVVSNPMNDGAMYTSSTRTKRNFMGSVLNDKSSSKDQKKIAGAYLQGSKDASMSALKKSDPGKYARVKQRMNRYKDCKTAFKK